MSREIRSNVSQKFRTEKDSREGLREDPSRQEYTLIRKAAEYRHLLDLRLYHDRRIH